MQRGKACDAQRAGDACLGPCGFSMRSDLVRVWGRAGFRYAAI